MAGYIGSKAVSVNTTSATISDDLTVGDDATITGDLDVDGTTNLDIVDIDGAVDMASTLQVDGVLTTGGDIIAKTGDGAFLQLQSSDTTITADSVLGSIFFNAPDEASGTDAVLIGASISAVATDTFAADNNSTDLRFATGASGAASTKMVLASDGGLAIGLTVPTAPLTLKSPANAEAIHIVGRSDDIGQIIFFEADGSTNLARVDARNNVFNVQSNAAIPMTLGTSSTARVTVETNGDLTIEDGNLVIGTSAHGIDFSAGASGTSTSNLLDEYEEGAWNATDASGAGLTLTVSKNTYTKIGRLVFVAAQIQWPSQSNSSTAKVALPFTAIAATSEMGGVVTEQNVDSAVTITASINETTKVIFRLRGQGGYTNAQLSGKKLRFSATYQASA